MTEAFAIKSPTGKLLRIALERDELHVHPSDFKEGYRCVPVTVSENGEEEDNTFICPRCKVDRLKEKCPEMRYDLCPIKGDAYLRRQG